jgi:hypothetical protein
VSETNAQTKTSDQGLLAAGFFVGLTPLYYAKINRARRVCSRLCSYHSGGTPISGELVITLLSSETVSNEQFGTEAARKRLRVVGCSA